jgi:hypothetical protein
MEMNKQLTIIITPSIQERINSACERDGFTEEEVVRVALISGLKKMSPDYLKPASGLGPGRPKKEDTRTAVDRRGSDICYALGGQVTEVNGKYMCKYNMYSELGGGVIDTAEIEEPLGTLSSDSVHNQYTDILGERGFDVKARLQDVLNSNNGK